MVLGKFFKRNCFVTPFRNCPKNQIASKILFPSNLNFIVDLKKVTLFKTFDILSTFYIYIFISFKIKKKVFNIKSSNSTFSRLPPSKSMHYIYMRHFIKCTFKWLSTVLRNTLFDSILF